MFLRPLFVLALCLLSPISARAEAAGAYVWHDAVMRATPAKIGSAYLEIDNPTTQRDTLLSDKASWADRVELHETTTNAQGVMTMQKIDRLDLPAKGGVFLQAGARHLMIFGIKTMPAINEKRDITLHFEKAGDITVPFIVQPLAAMPMHSGMTMPMDHSAAH